MNNMNNQRWLGTTLVKVERHFTVNSVSYSLVKPLGKEDDLVVPTTHLTEQPNKEYKSIFSDDNEAKTEELNDSEEIEEPVTEMVVIAQSTTDSAEVYVLGTDGELDSEMINELELDPAAIQRVLDGSQRTHKGFKFEISEVKV